MEIFGKKAVFPGGLGRIGEVPHGRYEGDSIKEYYCMVKL